MHWVETHGFEVILIYYAFASFVGALPTPSDKDGKGYTFFFNFAHGLAANALRIPQIRSFVGLQENPTTVAGIEAKADAQKIDPGVQGITKKPD